MKLICKYFFPFILGLSFIESNAQEIQTLTRSDGKKYFEGKLFIKNRNATLSRNSYFSDDRVRERNIPDNWASGQPPFLPENIFSQVVLDGVCKLFYKSGNTYISQEYIHGIAEGKYGEWYENGDPVIKGSYKSGMMDGEWKYFFKNGKTAFEGSFYAIQQSELVNKFSSEYISRNFDKENSFSEERFEFARPAITAFSTYDRFLVKLGTGINGRYNFYYYDGQKNVTINYKNGVPNGIWQCWDRNGKLLYKAEFEDGIAIMIEKDGIRSTYEESFQKQTVTEISLRDGDVNGIDPGIAVVGIVEAEPSAPFRFVEQMPEPTVTFPDWINKNLKYPIEAKKNGVEGRVIVQFVVRKDGSIKDIKVIRGIGSGCDQAAIELVKKMPRWKPGKQNGQTVDVYYTLPVTFKIA